MTTKTGFIYTFRIIRETGFLYSFFVKKTRLKRLKRETGEIEPAESLLNLPDLFFAGVILQNLPSSDSNQKIFPEFIPY